MAIQLETCESMITSIKALAQYVSSNTKGGWKKIPSMYKNIIFVMNSEDGETPADGINIQVIEISDTNTDTKARSLLGIGMKLQGLYYASLHIINVKQIAQVEWSCPSDFVPVVVSSLIIQTWNPMSNS